MLCDQCRAALPLTPKIKLPETITVLRMVANNVNREEPRIQSAPGDAMTFEMKPPYTIDLAFCPWYKPAKTYLITYLNNGRAVIYIGPSNLMRGRRFQGKPGIIERGTIEDCRTTDGHLQIIELKEYHAYMLAMRILDHKEQTWLKREQKRLKREQKRFTREQKRLKEERNREGRSLEWSERLGLRSWFLFKKKQPATNAKIPPSGVIRNTSKSTLTELFHAPGATLSSLQTLVDK